MQVEIGAALATLLGTIITTLGGIVVLWLNQRNEFRKARDQRAADREAAEQRSRQLDSNSEKRAAKLNTAAINRADALEQQVFGVAAQVAEKVEVTAAQVAETAASKTQIEEIHALVNGRMSMAIAEIVELKIVVGQLLAALGPGNNELRERAEVALSKLTATGG